MRKLIIVSLALLLVVSVAFAAQIPVKRGVGSVTPQKMTKGARIVPMQIYIGKNAAGAVRKFAPPADTVAGTLKFYLWQPPIDGWVANFYLTMGTVQGTLDSIPDEDSAANKAYRFRITKNSKRYIIGERKTRAIPAATVAEQLANVPSPGKRWFVTGSDTTSNYKLLTTDTLFFAVDTCGGVPDSLPQNMWINFEWYPGPNE
jgi:hypothetical protein